MYGLIGQLTTVPGQRDALFPDRWTLEPVEKPVHV